MPRGDGGLLGVIDSKGAKAGNFPLPGAVDGNSRLFGVKRAAMMKFIKPSEHPQRVDIKDISFTVHITVEL